MEDNIVLFPKVTVDDVADTLRAMIARRDELMAAIATEDESISRVVSEDSSLQQLGGGLIPDKAMMKALAACWGNELMAFQHSKETLAALLRDRTDNKKI